MKEFISEKEFKRQEEVLEKAKVQCKCGNREIIPYRSDKTICSRCGNYIYKNKKLEFKEKVGKELKKWKQKI